MVALVPSKHLVPIRIRYAGPSSTKYATLVEIVQEEKASGADAYDGALCKGD